MKKSFIIFIFLLLLSSCDVFNSLFFLPTTYEYGFNDPFAEIGTVFRETGSSSTNISKLIGSALFLESQVTPADSNCIFITVDFSDSSLKPEDYPQHVPFLFKDVSNFYNVKDGKKYNMAYGDYKPNEGVYTNDMTRSPIDPNIYYAKLELLPGGLLENALIGDNTNRAILLQVANYLNTTAGRKAVDDTSNWWQTVGRQDMGLADFFITVTNDGGIKILNHGINFQNNYYFNTQACYISAGRKVFGWKVSQAIQDWSLQADGLSVISNGTTIRVIWEGISNNMKPHTHGTVWTEWPENACVAGSESWLYTTDTAWFAGDTSLPFSRQVIVDPKRGKAAFTTVLDKDYSASVILQLMNRSGWGLGEENKKHPLLIPQPSEYKPGEKAVTFVLQSQFYWTNN